MKHFIIFVVCLLVFGCSNQSNVAGPGSDSVEQKIKIPVVVVRGSDNMKREIYLYSDGELCRVILSMANQDTVLIAENSQVTAEFYLSTLDGAKVISVDTVAVKGLVWDVYKSI